MQPHLDFARHRLSEAAVGPLLCLVELEGPGQEETGVSPLKLSWVGV